MDLLKNSIKFYCIKNHKVIKVKLVTCIITQQLFLIFFFNNNFYDM